jgi:hypothetical protein
MSKQSHVYHTYVKQTYMVFIITKNISMFKLMSY